jgi:hypothetical protein
VCDKWWSCLRPPSEYTYTAAWHMPIIKQARREEKKMSDDKNEKRCHLFSFSLIFSDDDDVACRILSLCFLHTIIHVYASINCQSVQIDRCI